LRSLGLSNDYSVIAFPEVRGSGGKAGYVEGESHPKNTQSLKSNLEEGEGRVDACRGPDPKKSKKRREGKGEYNLGYKNDSWKILEIGRRIKICKVCAIILSSWFQKRLRETTGNWLEPGHGHMLTSKLKGRRSLTGAQDEGGARR